jgi:hypothetical protein
VKRKTCETHLGTHHGVRIERVANHNSFSAGYHTLHEGVEDVFVDEHTRLARADFTLVEGEEYCTLDGLVQESVVL